MPVNIVGHRGDPH